MRSRQSGGEEAQIRVRRCLVVVAGARIGAVRHEARRPEALEAAGAHRRIAQRHPITGVERDVEMQVERDAVAVDADHGADVAVVGPTTEQFHPDVVTDQAGAASSTSGSRGSRWSGSAARAVTWC